MTRRTLNNRRMHEVLTVRFPPDHADGTPDPRSVKYHIGFGYEEGQAEVLEVFADGRRTGSDTQAMISDACIAISMLLQCGQSCSALAASFGEVRDEGATSGPPASVLGLIARTGAELEAQLKGPQLALVPK